MARDDSVLREIVSLTPSFEHRGWVDEANRSIRATLDHLIGFEPPDDSAGETLIETCLPGKLALTERGLRFHEQGSYDSRAFGGEDRRGATPSLEDVGL